VGRSGHFCYTDNNNKLVIEGGLTNHNISYPDESLPENARLSPATCLVNGVMFLFGGSGKCQPENPYFINSKLFVKKAVVGEKWKMLDCEYLSKETPPGRYGASLTASECGGYLILFGGTDGNGYFRDVWRLQLVESDDDDLGLLEWKQLTKSEDRDTVRYYQNRRNIPSPRYKHASFIKNQCLFIVGGGQYIDCSGTFANIRDAQMDAMEILHVFDLNACFWKVQNTKPCPVKSAQEIDVLEGFPNNRLNMAWTLTKGFLYIIGGEQVRKTKINEGFAKRRPFNDVWKLDLEFLIWKFVTYLPDDEVGKIDSKLDFVYNLYNYGPMNFGTWGLTYHSCCLSVSKNYLYVFGGYKNTFHAGDDGETRHRRTTVLKYCLNTSTLYEIAENVLAIKQ